MNARKSLNPMQFSVRYGDGDCDYYTRPVDFRGNADMERTWKLEDGWRLATVVRVPRCTVHTSHHPEVYHAGDA